jgi:hypothetical protein
MKIGRKDYARTLDLPKKEPDVYSLLAEQQAWLKTRKRKKQKGK